MSDAGVTVTGANSKPVTINFPSAVQAAIAQQLANTIDAGVAAGTLVPTDAIGISAPPGSTPTELIVQSPGAILLNQSDIAVVVDATKSVDLLGDGVSNQSVIAGSGGLTYLTDGGSGTIVAAGGANRIVTSATGPAGWYVSTGAGNDTLASLTGDDTLSAGLGHNQVILGSGDNLVDVSGHDTILAGTGAETVAIESGGSAVVFGASSTLLFIGGNLADTVDGGSGTATIFGGTQGGDYIGGSAGNNLIYAAGTITGGGSGDQLYATGTIATQIHAGAGNESLSSALSSGADTLFAGSGADTITLGASPNTVVAGTGAATIFGGMAPAVYEFIKGSAGGSDLISGFDAGGTVKLVGYDQNEITNALNSAKTTAGGTTITLSDDTKITFAEVADLSKTHFSG